MESEGPESQASFSEAVLSRATLAATPDPGAAFDLAISRAEASLREGEPQIAESHYRSALLGGWLLVGTLERLDGRLPEAREAFRTASVSVVENRVALQALAFVDLQMGEAARAIADPASARRERRQGRDDATAARPGPGDERRPRAVGAGAGGGPRSRPRRPGAVVRPRARATSS